MKPLSETLRPWMRKGTVSESAVGNAHVTTTSNGFRMDSFLSFTRAPAAQLGAGGPSDANERWWLYPYVLIPLPFRNERSVPYVASFKTKLDWFAGRPTGKPFRLCILESVSPDETAAEHRFLFRCTKLS